MQIDASIIRTIVRREIRRTGSPVNDEDLVQDAALRACEAFRRQFEVRHPQAFLRKVVADTVRDYWRRYRPTRELQLVEEVSLAESPQFEERLDRQRRIDLIRRALAELDAAKRSTVDLYYLQELSVGDIATRQQRSVSAVKMELLRARRLIAETVRELSAEKQGKGCG